MKILAVNREITISICLSKKGVSMFNFKKKIRFLTFTLLLASVLLLPIMTATAQLKSTLEGHTDIVWSVAFRPNGVMLASASWDKTIRLWNVKTGRLLHTLTGHTNDIMSVAFSPDGQTLASASWDATIRLWNPNNGQLKRTLTEHAGGVASVAFSPDGNTLASGSADRTIRLWNTTTWKVDRTLTGHTDVVEIVAFSPDSNTLASGSRDTTIRLWNPNNGRHKRTLTEHTAPVSTIAFSSDGNTLASGSRDQTIRLWNPNNGREKETLTGYTDGVNPVAFSPDGGATLLIGGRGISVWDTETGQYKKPFAGDIGGVLSVVFSPDGQLVASGSPDNKVRLWEFNVSDYEPPSITTNGMVRLVYFVPSDRQSRESQVTALRDLLKEAHRFYADEMEKHGFGRKTFNFEYDEQGEPIVHEIRGKFSQRYYDYSQDGNPEYLIWKELVPYFDDLHHVFFVAMDSNREVIGLDAGGIGGPTFFTDNERFYGYVPSGLRGGSAMRHRDFTDGEQTNGGFAVIPAFNIGPHQLGVTLHELGHTFALEHDSREPGNTNYSMGWGNQSRLSKCEAEWLSVHSFFNPERTHDNNMGRIDLVQTQLLDKNLIDFRFTVADEDGLHQANLLVPDAYEDTGTGAYNLFDCQQLKGNTGTVQSFVRREAVIDRVTLEIIDMEGNVTWATFFIQSDLLTSGGDSLDVEDNGTVDLLDLAFISDDYGKLGKGRSDVNGDSIVDITDVLLIASSISSFPTQLAKTFASADILKWLDDANSVNLENEAYQRGFIGLTLLLEKIKVLSQPVGLTGDNPKVISGHTHFVWSIAFSPDSQLLASGSWDRTVRLWSVNTGEMLDAFLGHENDVMTVAFSPNNRIIASGGWDATIRLWDIGTGEQERVLTHRSAVSSVAFSPTGHMLASGMADSTVLLWNTTTWEIEKTLRGHSHTVDFVIFSPDGTQLASSSRDKTVRLWNPDSGKLLHTLGGHTAQVTRMAFNPDGNILASGGRDHTIRLSDVHTGKRKQVLTDHIDGNNPIAFTPDGTTLVIGTRGIWLWDIEGEKYKRVVDENLPNSLSIAFSPDGSLFASGDVDHNIRLWDVQTLLGKRRDSVDVNGDGVVNILDLVSVSANFGKTGENIADVNGDGIVNIVDLVKVAGEMGAGAAAPTAHPQTQEILTAADVQHWLRQAQHANLTDATSQRGILMLQQLLTALIPKETSLLPNYPNPFNPETWIPYQLSESAEVTLHIYAVDGRLIRTLTLGHQPAGMYHSKNRAVYWDGRNEIGESVASGVYLYTLSAGDFSATRKMLIRK